VSPGVAAQLTGATLELDAVRFRESAGALTLRSNARTVGLIGEWGELFRACADGTVAGEARVCGLPLGCALERGVAAIAPCDPELPPSFTVREYLEHSARLAHGARARAISDAERALESAGLAAISGQKLAQIALGDRRALVLSAAMLNEPAVCLLEAPLRGLDAATADRLLRVCSRIAERSRVIVSCEPPATPSPTRALLDACEELFRLEGGRLTAHGAPDEVLASGPHYRVTFAGSHSKSLEDALIAAGCWLSFRDQGAVNGHPATRYEIELPSGARPAAILDAAANVGVTLLELEPLGGE